MNDTKLKPGIKIIFWSAKRVEKWPGNEGYFIAGKNDNKWSILRTFISVLNQLYFYCHSVPNFITKVPVIATPKQ